MSHFDKSGIVVSSSRKTRMARDVFVSTYLEAIKFGKSPEAIAIMMDYSHGQLTQRVKSLNEELTAAYRAGNVPTEQRVLLPTPVFSGGGKKGRKKSNISDLIALLGDLVTPEDETPDEGEESDPQE